MLILEYARPLAIPSNASSGTFESLAHLRGWLRSTYFAPRYRVTTIKVEPDSKAQRYLYAIHNTGDVVYLGELSYT